MLRYSLLVAFALLAFALMAVCGEVARESCVHACCGRANRVEGLRGVVDRFAELARSWALVESSAAVSHVAVFSAGAYGASLVATAGCLRI